MKHRYENEQKINKIKKYIILIKCYLFLFNSFIKQLQINEIPVRVRVGATSNWAK